MTYKSVFPKIGLYSLPLIIKGKVKSTWSFHNWNYLWYMISDMLGQSCRFVQRLRRGLYVFLLVVCNSSGKCITCKYSYEIFKNEDWAHLYISIRHRLIMSRYSINGILKNDRLSVGNNSGVGDIVSSTSSHSHNIFSCFSTSIPNGSMCCPTTPTSSPPQRHSPLTMDNLIQQPRHFIHNHRKLIDQFN